MGPTNDPGFRCPRCGAPLLALEAACPACAAGALRADETRTTPAGDTPGVMPPGPELPERVGEFRILRLLGRGGMASVYEAEQDSMRRRVALKIIRGVPEGGGGIERFEREAWIAGRLSHPHIVKVHARGSDDERHWIAMELVEGGSLRDEIRAAASEKPAPGEGSAWWRRRTRRLVGLFAEVADALEEVHRKGFVHRDIKPGNLLLSGDGTRLLLSDFGLARDPGASRLTRQGDLLGTMRYMSPEQLFANSESLDLRTDIYSLGVSLYEALTLTLPHQGETEEAYVAALASKEPARARERNASIPRDVETILMKCLERDPDRRYASSAELAEDLHRFLRGLPVLARRPGILIRSARFLGRHRWVAAGVAAGLAIAAVLFAGYWRSTERRQAKLAAHEITLAGLEESPFDLRRESSRERKASDAERTLRDAFLTGDLPEEFAIRFGRSLLTPWIPLSSHVERGSGTPLVAYMERFHFMFSLVAVVELTVRVDDRVVARTAPLPSWGPITLLPAGEVASLPPGPHELVIEVRAWFFDSEAHGRKYGIPSGPSHGAGAIWNPSRTPEGARYGPNLDRTWEELWEEMRETDAHRALRPFRVTSRQFLVVEELPPGYPAALSTSELDERLRRALVVDGIELAPGYVRFGLHAAEPLPANVVGRLSFVLPPDVVVAEHPLVLYQGMEGEIGGGAAAVAWSDGLTRMTGRPLEEWVARAKAGEAIGLGARFESDREIAARTPGVDSFWNGVLRFEAARPAALTSPARGRRLRRISWRRSPWISARSR